MGGYKRMGFNVEPYGGKRDPGSVTMSRSRGIGGEMDEMQELFEQMMEGGEEGEELEEFDWEGLWDSFMGEEGGQEQQQGSQYPTMFGAPIRPGGFRNMI
jgi:hypothetical protein